MLRPFGEQQPPPDDLPDEAEQHVGLAEGVAVRLEDLLVGLGRVDEQRLLVGEGEVADEGGGGVGVAPGDLELVGGGGAEEVDELAEEGVVVLWGVRFCVWVGGLGLPLVPGGDAGGRGSGGR